MKRKGLCLITNCAEKRLDTMVTRGQWIATKGEGAQAQYTLEDAFRLRLLLVAMDHAGADIETATYLLNGVGDLSMHPLNYPRSHGDMWIAAGVVKTGNPDFPSMRIHVGGRLQDLHDLAHNRFAPEAGEVLETLLSVNVSEVAHFVRNEAMEIGLPEGRDFSQVWPYSQFPVWMKADLDSAAAIMAELNGGV